MRAIGRVQQTMTRQTMTRQTMTRQTMTRQTITRQTITQQTGLGRLAEYRMVGEGSCIE
jgi:hypothetical protein